ncbi:hypothetical protein L218DRAFT_135527 [Marasmius fiardii PR-910]|nr:hypothetical protein L218DRAFT_135527 [Marasmius fiardii PR-910]
MIFEGKKACFSPQVPHRFRIAWVENGGSLTHSTRDFFNADFFFCAGIKDTWLQQLRSRDIIVRHASWIIRCVEENFLMPCSKYILDECFDDTTIHHYHDSREELDNSGIDMTRAFHHYSVSQDTTLTLCDQEQPVDALPNDLATSADSLSAHSRPSLRQLKGCKLRSNFEDGRDLESPELKKLSFEADRNTLRRIRSSSRRPLLALFGRELYAGFDQCIKPISDDRLQVIPFSSKLPLPCVDQTLTSCPPRLSLTSLLSLPEIESTLFKPTERYMGKLMWVDRKRLT